MAVVEIPVQSQRGPYNFKIILSGITLNLSFRWNWRMERWVMDVSDSNNNTLVNGVVLVLGVDLLAQYKGDDDNYPQGIMYMQDSTEKGIEANWENFGVTTFLLYDDLEG